MKNYSFQILQLHYNIYRLRAPTLPPARPPLEERDDPVVPDVADLFDELGEVDLFDELGEVDLLAVEAPFDARPLCDVEGFDPP